LIPLCFVAAVMGMGFFVAPWAIGFIFVITFLEGFHYPILNALLNRSLPPGKRATIISLGSVLACLMGAFLYPALGWIADLFSLQVTFKVLGFGMFVCVAVILVLLREELASNSTMPGL
jgi:MFS family permease